MVETKIEKERTELKREAYFGMLATAAFALMSVYYMHNTWKNWEKYKDVLTFDWSG